jgi:hypothetical protein
MIPAEIVNKFLLAIAYPTTKEDFGVQYYQKYIIPKYPMTDIGSAQKIKRRVLLTGAGVFILLFSTMTMAQQTGAKPGHAVESKDMRLVGSHDLQARSAYQPVIHNQNGRWIAYIGHHGGTESTPKSLNPLTGTQEYNGTSILDVTDPKHPKYLFHIPGEVGFGESGGAQMVRLCNGKDLPKGDRNKIYLLRTLGNSAHEIWDVTNPSSPSLLTSLSGLKGTHKNWWECDTGIAYLVSGLSDWRTRRMTQVYDFSDPAKPVFIRNFGLAGQQPGSTGPVPTEVHGAISLGSAKNRIYFGYGTGKGGILQIVDRDKLLNGPKEPTPENLLYPQISRLDISPLVGAHTVFPVLGMEVAEFAKDREGKTRDFIVLVNEATANECQEARHMVFMVDITVESHPFSVANYTVPEASGNFCSRGGRFGAHASHENFTPIYYKKIIFTSWFNAGVRATDIRDPYNPKEVAYYIPATTANTDKRCVKTGEVETCKVAIQTNNIEVDDRGYIYLADRANTGLHIVELTGKARQIASFPK